MKTSNVLCRLRTDTSGLAAVELALALPVMLALLFGGMETANLAITHLRVSQMASMTADNAARVRDRIDEVDVNDIFIGSRLASAGTKVTTNGRVILSVVEDNAATTTNTTDQIITWQRCKGLKVPPSTFGTEGQVLTTGIGTAANRISATPGNPVIFVEIYYEYKPLISSISTPIIGTQTIRYSSAFSVRERSLQAIQNGANLSAAQKSTCNFFTET